MFCQILFVLCIGTSLSYAAPTSIDDTEAKIIEYENVNEGNGDYYFRYVTSNGIEREEKGTLVKSSQLNALAYIKVEGAVSYVDSNGQKISLKYTADQNGYQVSPSEPEILPITVVSGTPSLIVASLLGG